jgi:hypothetical protein
MATIVLLAPKGAKIAKKKQAIKRVAKNPRKTVAKRAVKTVRRRNPSAEVREAAVRKWVEYGRAHGVKAAKINEGAQVMRVMPDPSKIKSLSALAQAIGVRGTNPMKRVSVRKPSSGHNYAYAEKVGRTGYKICGWASTRDLAINRAQDIADRKNVKVAVLSRADVMKAKHA